MGKNLVGYAFRKCEIDSQRFILIEFLSNKLEPKDVLFDLSIYLFHKPNLEMKFSHKYNAYGIFDVNNIYTKEDLGLFIKDLKKIFKRVYGHKKGLV